MSEPKCACVWVCVCVHASCCCITLISSTNVSRLAVYLRRAAVWLMGCLLSHALRLATCCRCSCCRDVCSLCHSINSHYQRLSSPHLYRMCAVAPLNKTKKKEGKMGQARRLRNWRSWLQTCPLPQISCSKYFDWAATITPTGCTWKRSCSPFIPASAGAPPQLLSTPVL